MLAKAGCIDSVGRACADVRLLQAAPETTSAEVKTWQCKDDTDNCDAQGSNYDTWEANCEKCQDTMPICTDEAALVVLILNVMFPGLGSMVSAYCAVDGFCYPALHVGIWQMLTSWLVVGYVWSIFQGVGVYKRSTEFWQNKYGDAEVKKAA